MLRTEKLSSSSCAATEEGTVGGHADLRVVAFIRDAGSRPGYRCSPNSEGKGLGCTLLDQRLADDRLFSVRIDCSYCKGPNSLRHSVSRILASLTHSTQHRPRFQSLLLISAAPMS